MSRRRVLNSGGLEVTQDEYNGMVRAIGNLSRLVVFLEDKIDALTRRDETPVPESQLPTVQAEHRGSSSGQTPGDSP